MAITGRYFTTDKPTFMGNNNEFKDWTTDPKKGDKFYTGEGSGQGWYPIWRTESEMAALPLQKFSEELSNPNSKYYKDYSDRLKRTLSAGTSTESLLALNKGMGLGSESSALIANEQNKANIAKINDAVTNASKDLFLSNTGNALNATNSVLSNAQFNQNINFQKDMYNKQKSDSILNNVLSLVGGIGATIATGGLSSVASAVGTTVTPSMTGFFRMK